MQYEKINVRITPSGALRAYPAIWYYDKAHEQFPVVKSKYYPAFYEVSEGEYKGKIIDKKDCIKLDNAG